MKPGCSLKSFAAPVVVCLTAVSQACDISPTSTSDRSDAYCDHSMESPLKLRALIINGWQDAFPRRGMLHNDERVESIWQYFRCVKVEHRQNCPYLDQECPEMLGSL